MDDKNIGVIHEQGEFNDIKQLTAEEQALIREREAIGESIEFLDTMGLEAEEIK